MEKEQEETYQEFKSLVNMSPGELEKWLKTDHSKEVGYTEEGSRQSIGHQSGEKIVKINQKNKSELSDDDFAHMKKVISYIKRHSAQRPSGDVTDTRWRYSLMNWGHDPNKK